jgi:hypothetical protein
LTSVVIKLTEGVSMGSNLGRLQEDGQWRFNPQREAAALGFLRRHRGVATTASSPELALAHAMVHGS